LTPVSRFAVALKRAFKDQFKGGQIALEEKAAIEQQPRGIIKEGVKIGASHFTGPPVIRQPGSLEHVGLPQVIGVVGLPAIQVLIICDFELSGRKPPCLQCSMERGPAQEARGSHLHVLHNGDDALNRALWHLEFEFAGACYEFFRYGPHAPVCPGLVLKGFKAP
jgi:hypothetical protein